MHRAGSRIAIRLIASLSVLISGVSSTAAQVEKNIYRFAGTPDGEAPNGELVADRAGNLYGTTILGGAHGFGTVFELKRNANGSYTETVLYSFASNPDGANPAGGVVLDEAGNLYGTTYYGGGSPSINSGIAYELSPPAKGGTQWVESILFDFSTSISAVGANPAGSLVFDSAGNLYGAAAAGGGGDALFCGDAGCGDIFQLQPPSVAGGVWTANDIHDFLVIPQSDGIAPEGLAMSADGKLYGYTAGGAIWINQLGGFYSNKGGGVYRLSPSNGGGQWEEQLLYLFQYNSDPSGIALGSDNQVFVSTRYSGDDFGPGSIVELTPSSSGVIWSENVIYTFTGGADGKSPEAPPLLDPMGDLYVTTAFGGTNNCAGSTEPNCGTFVKLTPNGNGTYTESTIFEFNQAGYNPEGGLLLRNGFFIGANFAGGTTTGQGPGTIFEIRP
ncbi:MAG TPA: choice-of-anchor tandem repeat GloVer-containing protein [Candidatus Binatia bacterium]|nr:choice-of-anchor tandem repeat GloVer-containing protein [Candidatus Binatia bacterium]